MSTYGQKDKTIIVTTTPKTVPIGKKWILEAGKTTRVQLSYSVLNSGSACNALFKSVPRMITGLSCGTRNKSENHLLFINKVEKVPYTNDYTYDLSIFSIAKKDFSFYDLETKSPDEVGTKRIEFIEGESVFVCMCLESIELQEINMTQSEIQEVNKNEKEINKANQLKLSTFNIPVNPHKYVEPGTKPEIHDANLKRIVFSSESVSSKQSDKGLTFDDEASWTISLSADNFRLQSLTGIDKHYNVIKIEYDELLKMQKFILGNSRIEITHYLLVSWSNLFKQYFLILQSTDNSEEFQFQEVQSIDKQY